MTDVFAELPDVIKSLPAWSWVLLLLALVLICQRVVARQISSLIEPQPFLEADKWKTLPLVDKLVLNHNTRQFRCFAFIPATSQQDVGNEAAVLILQQEFASER